MKILFVFNHPAPYKVRLFNEIAKLVDLDVIFERTKAKDRPADFYNCNTYDFNVKFLKRGSFGNENSLTNELKKIIKKSYRNYDLIIMNGYSTLTEMKAINYMKKKNIPFALYINGGVVRKETKLKAKIKKHFISSAFTYFSPCIEADEYLKHYGVKEELIHHYPYSTFYEREIVGGPISDIEKNRIREEFNLPKGNLYISAGQYIDRKNNLLLISLFKDLKDKQLVLFGQGPLKEAYLKYINENNITNVTVREFLKKNDLFTVMSACDCFVTLSKEDIYGHTTTEAMANGLPVISSDRVVSSRHLIQNGKNGYIVSLDKEEEIKNAINSINTNMIFSSILTAKENTIEKTAEAHAEIFKDIVK